MVSDAQAFPNVWRGIKWNFNVPIFAHNASFDFKCLEKALERYSLKKPDTVFYDTLAASRILYTQFSNHKLTTVCDFLGISIEKHHSAKYDALACAEIAIKIIKNHGSAFFTNFNAQKICYPFYNHGFDDYNNEQKKSESSKLKKLNSNQYVNVELNYSSTSELTEFHGTKIVLTGDGNINRQELIEILNSLGAKVVNFVIVGEEDISRVKDTENYKSGKIIKAENLIEQGANIKFLKLSEIEKMIKSK